MPPPYSVATSLPTYDEAEKAKAAAMAAVAAETSQRVRKIPFLRGILFLLICTFSNIKNSSLYLSVCACRFFKSILILLCVIIFLVKLALS